MQQQGAPDEFRCHWGPAVRKRREELGLSQYALADAAGLRHYTVSEIERGKQYGADVTRLALARALRMEVHELFPFPAVTRAAS